MKTIELKTVNPAVFDDPEFCNSVLYSCAFLDYMVTVDEFSEESKEYNYCWLFNKHLDEPDISIIKCQECKDHYNKNKYPITGSKPIADAASRIIKKANAY